MLASFKRFVKYRSALPFGDGNRGFLCVLLRIIQQNYFRFLGFFVSLVLFWFCFSFVQGSGTGPPVEVTTCVLKQGIKEGLLQYLWKEQNPHYIKCIRKC